MVPGFHDEEGSGLAMRYTCPVFLCDCWVSPGPTDVEDWCQHFLEMMAYGEDEEDSWPMPTKKSKDS